MNKKKKIFLLCLFITYIWLILFITGIDSIYFWQEASLERINLVPSASLSDIGYKLNIILFVPMGILIPLIWAKERNIYHVLLLGFLVSLTIEMLQIFCMRATDIDDLIANTIGCLLGYLVFKIINKIKKEKSKEEIEISSNFNTNTSALWIFISFISYLIIYH